MDFLAAHQVLAAHPPTPPGLIHPPAVWIYNIAIPIAATALFIVFSVQSYRRKTFTWWWLFFVVGASCSWLETFGDWGQYLVYSPQFWHYHLPFRHTSPDNPYFMPAAYGIYWGIHAIIVLRLAEWIGRRTGLSRGWGVLLLSAPFGYAWDIVVETTSAHFGWWSYETPIGPYFDAGRGLQPLVVPIVVMFTWPNLMAWMTGDPRDTGLNRIERMFRLDRLARPAQTPNHEKVLVASNGTGLAASVTTAGVHPAGQPARDSAVDSAIDPAAQPAVRPAWNWRFELARLGTWVVVFWISFAVLLDAVLILLRLTIGHPSSYVP